VGEKPLDKYRAKRDASRTPEPFGGGVARPGIFVLQKHAARHTHFDLRLELEGVLKSWAVPRGPSLDPDEKRAAILVEDHPVEYADFEGVIPEGEYGAGEVIVWDLGRWTPLEDPVEGMKSGKLLFTLSGHKLRGLWTLVRTKARSAQDRDAPSKEWLLIKKPDAFATKVPPPDESVLSGLKLGELGEARARVERIAAAADAAGAPKRPVALEHLPLMLAETAEAPFSKPGWIFEIKYDGFRLLIARRDGKVIMRYRSGQDATHIFPDVARAAAGLPARDFLLDAEVVVHDESGRPVFNRLQQRTQLSRAADIARAAVDYPAVVHAFDLLAFEGRDLRPLPLLARKTLLRELLPPVGTLRYADHVEERGAELFEEVKRLGLEGLMAKRADSPYRGARSTDWLKVKVEHTGDFAILGFTAPKGSRTGLGALHLGWAIPNRPGVWFYAGRVGSGLSEEELGPLHRELEANKIPKKPPFTGAPPDTKGTTWVKPTRVCEVRWHDWPEGGVLRFPVFLRLRDDKPPEECFPQQAHTDEPPPPAAAAPAPEVHRSVSLTNESKIFYPAVGLTKGDLLAYHRAVAPHLLRYLRDRPLVVTRYPDGVDGKSFFQKDAPSFAPSWLRTERMWSQEAEREVDQFIVDDVESLLWLANLGAIPLHVWASRVATLQTPDWCVLDLDPKGAPWANVIAIALALHALCRDIGIPVYPKTSGSTGMHLLIPLGRRLTFDEARAFAELLARVVAAELPDLATTERVVAERAGRVYVDYLQNGQGKLIAAPLTPRPVADARVSMPLRWDDVGPALDPSRYTIKTTPEILAADGDPMATVLDDAPDLAAALERLAARFSRAQ
jgi:bifunctional non-homologous end joining protein LigD